MPPQPNTEPTADQAAAPQGEGELNMQQVLIQKLQSAYATEMVSAYQYRFARIQGVGSNRSEFHEECTKHEEEELEHADQLAECLQILLGPASAQLVPFNFEEVIAAAEGPKFQLEDITTEVLTQQIIQAEQFAVQTYTELSAMTADAGPELAGINDVINGILHTEQKHVFDMTNILLTIGVDNGGSEQVPQA